MSLCATLAFVAYFGLAFVIRSWLQWRSTGSTGFVGLRRGAGPLERVAGLSMVAASLLAPIAPWVGAPLVRVPWLSALGLVLVALGTAGTFAAQITMGASWRIGVDPTERSALVTAGAFRYVRNPIFTAMLVAALGFALACPTPLALALPAVLLLALETQVRVVEEPYLLRAHGAAYQTWAAHTGRFLPGVGKQKSLPTQPSSCPRGRAVAPPGAALTSRRTP